MNIESVFIGGWFQRTTLHLTEIYEFFKRGVSELGFSEEALKNARANLHLKGVRRVNAMLEYVHASTEEGIELRIYEDGLMVLRREAQAQSVDVQRDFALLERYYDGAFSPALSLIFSKGAPIPKELAHMKALFPFVVVTRAASDAEIAEFFQKMKLEVYAEMQSSGTRVYKSGRVILIVSRLPEEQVRQLVEAQIFFREFKAQLHRYLNIHRNVWESIAAIKEQGKVRGTDIKQLRTQLDDAQKTIKLIENRINQMATYLRTRSKIAASQRVDKLLDQMFVYKYETLEDTLAYVKELWKMTDNYLSAAIAKFNEFQAESTKNSISSLRLVTTLGVVAGIVGYLSKDALPLVTWQGGVFFVVLLVLTWLFNEIVTRHYARKWYVLRKEEQMVK